MQLHNKNHARVREACQDTLKQLRLDYLVRAPVPCQCHDIAALITSMPLASSAAAGLVDEAERQYPAVVRPTELTLACNYLQIALQTPSQGAYALYARYAM